MTRRQVVRAAIEHRRPPYVPWQLGFTCEARQKLSEHSARALGYAGDAVIQTPNIDRLAREGLVFHRAYTTQPLCTPGRGFRCGRHCVEENAPLRQPYKR